jgi:glycosyltransferase involved in cell wall biosynthesis
MAHHLLVFADDWGRHPSSCQHLVRHLLAEHPTTWVNTIGTRTPRLDLQTVRRAAGKVRAWLRPNGAADSAVLPKGLDLLNPKMWPWLSHPFDRRLNRDLLQRQLRRALKRLPEPPVAITTLPVVADLMGHLPVRKWVYYCVDDFSEWPGLDRRALAQMERRVVERADTLVAASEPLQTRLAEMGRSAHLLTHGVDLDFWRTSHEPVLTPWDRPLIVFWGVVDRRMDTAFVRHLAEALRYGTIVLAGPDQNPDPDLARLPHVVCPGPIPFQQLPALAREAAVLVMPYADAPVTRAMQPLKLKEYLATGKPVVARDLPANREWADALDLVTTPEEFTAAVLERLETDLPSEQQAARRRLKDESWAAKAEVFAGFLA